MDVKWVTLKNECSFLFTLKRRFLLIFPTFELLFNKRFNAEMIFVDLSIVVKNNGETIPSNELNLQKSIKSRKTHSTETCPYDYLTVIQIPFLTKILIVILT